MREKRRSRERNPARQTYRTWWLGGARSLAAAQRRICLSCRLSNPAQAVSICRAWWRQFLSIAEESGDFAAGRKPARNRAVSFGLTDPAARALSVSATISATTLRARIRYFCPNCFTGHRGISCSGAIPVCMSGMRLGSTLGLYMRPRESFRTKRKPDAAA